MENPIETMNDIHEQLQLLEDVENKMQEGLTDLQKEINKLQSQWDELEKKHEHILSMIRLLDDIYSQRVTLTNHI